VSILKAIRHRRFSAGEGTVDFDELALVFDERCSPYGVRGDAERQARGNRNSYAFMASSVLRELAADVPLVVLAHVVPDCDPSLSVAGYFDQHLDARPQAFAVSEQGRTTAFSALRLAGNLLAGGGPGGGYDTVAVVALDQGTVAYDDPGLAALDTGTDHAVVLLLGREDHPGARPAALRHRSGVTPARAPDALAAELAGLAGEHPVVVVGDLPGQPRDERTAGQLCTAALARLAAELATPAPQPRRVVVVEYEPALGYLGLAAFDVPAHHAVPAHLAHLEPEASTR
jgi:hypothetical protein